MDNNYWVLYASHDKPKFFKDAGGGQKAQREASMKYVSSYRNALDIGSNIGQWTRPLAKIFDKVICFEPNPNFRECFKRNISESNVILHPYGLSSHEHTAEQGKTDTHLNHKVGDTDPREGDIQCRSLDSFDLRNVDYIKIDVDGFEVPLLEGARETLTINSPVINIEMKRRKRPMITRKATGILNDLGYQYVKTTKSDEIWIKS
tara:strand:- start:4820 stop:5434 length:615 start_codon:yes stop_codon:yes gene_type:complete